MSESKHTPGPWRYQEGTDAYTHIVHTGVNRFLCQLAQDTSGVAEANARLIAAAPDLLEALQLVCATLGQSNDWRDDSQMARKARAAIAKAIEP
jgi:hypothetical protein